MPPMPPPFSCMFGDFSASLSVVTHQHGVTVYHSKGRDLTNIGRLFTERTGNQYIQGDIWNRMISNVYDVGRHSDCEAKVRCNAMSGFRRNCGKCQKNTT